MSVIGLRVGPFEIVEPASLPEPGDWYRARRTGITRRQPTDVLVKLLPPDADAAARAALQVEFDNLRAMEDVRVPAAVALYEGIGAIALDAPDGIGLDEVVTARRLGTVALAPATLLDLGLDIAETLQHAHHRNRVHGHLHPGLIRLSLQGKLHLFGFGQAPFGLCPPGWTSPERAAGAPPGPATDQWALGAVLCGLIAGATPWGGTDPLAQARVGDPEPLLDPIERQWPALARLFRRMLAPDSANRYPSMQPVRQELMALARKAGGTSERRELAQIMARQLDRRMADPSTEPPTDGAADPPVAAEPAVAADPADAAAPAVAAAPAIVPAPAVRTPPPAPAQPTPRPASPRRPLPTPPEPAQAARDEEVPLLRPAPLVAEPLVPVLPDLVGEVPRARRDDEDISDDPTVRYDPRLLDPALSTPTPPRAQATPEPSPSQSFGLGSLIAAAATAPPPGDEDLTEEPPALPDPPPAPATDTDDPDLSLPDIDIARVIAAGPTPPSGPGRARFGEGPTAVPATDVSSDPGAPPRAPPPIGRPTPPGLPDPLDRGAEPDGMGTPVRPVRTPVHVQGERESVPSPGSGWSLEEPVAARRADPLAPQRSTAQSLAPWLVIAALVLMLATVVLALW